MSNTDVEVVNCRDGKDAKLLTIIKKLENGYYIAQDATLTDGGTFLKNQDFCLINPDGKILIHANDAESLETYASNPEILANIERTGMV